MQYTWNIHQFNVVTNIYLNKNNIIYTYTSLELHPDYTYTWISLTKQLSIYIIEILNIIYFSYGGEGGTCDDGAETAVLARMLARKSENGGEGGEGGGAGEDVQREKLCKWKFSSD